MRIAYHTVFAALLGTCPASGQAMLQDDPTYMDGTSRAVVKDGEVHIYEPDRPTGVRKSFSGICGDSRYTVAIDPGRPLAEAIRSLESNGTDRREAAYRAIAKGPPVEGDVIDAMIAECGKDAAKVRFMIPATTGRRELRFYDLWLLRDGTARFLHEQ